MMPYEEACRILAPWIEEGKASVLREPGYGPGPRLWGVHNLGVCITYLPYPPAIHHLYTTPQIELSGIGKYQTIPQELKEAAHIFSARLRGPSAFM